MTTLRTAVRLTLAVLTVSLGATLATAADNKPAAPPVVKKPNGWSFGATNPTVKSARDLDGNSTGRAKPSSIGDTATHEVGHVAGPKMAPNNAKPVGGRGK